ncbi:MAG TPA: hypothetical protein H9683_01650 [Firmicutes bacterium]|nr:hypothetical protein [Bacillota bacterium]
MSGKRGAGLTDEKMRKIAAGATVAGVLLVLFLVIILIVQFVQIGVANRRRAELEAAIAQVEEDIRNGQSDLESMQAREELIKRAMELGWKLP